MERYFTFESATEGSASDEEFCKIYRVVIEVIACCPDEYEWKLAKILDMDFSPHREVTLNSLSRTDQEVLKKRAEAEAYESSYSAYEHYVDAMADAAYDVWRDRGYEFE